MLAQETAQVGLELDSAISEEPRSGIGHRKVVGHHCVDISDQVWTSRCIDGSRSAKACLQQRVFESRRLALAPGSEIVARALAEIGDDEIPSRGVRNARIARAFRPRPSVNLVGDE